MASGVINGEGDDEVKDKKFYRVYRRKVRGLKKDENRTKGENDSIEDSTQIVVSQEVLNPVAQDDNAQEAVARVDRDSAVVDKKLTEIRHETLTQGLNSELIDKKLIEAPPSQEDVTTLFVAETSIKMHSQTPVEKDADPLVFEKNSIDLPSESPVEEHFDMVVVDKDAIEMPSGTPVKKGDFTVVVDRKSNDVLANSQGQDVSIDVVDKQSVEAPPEDFGTGGANNDLLQRSSRTPTHVNPLSCPQDMSTDVPVAKSIGLALETIDQEHISTIIADKKSIEASLIEDPNVVVLDTNPIPAAQPLVSASSLTQKHPQFSVQGAVDTAGMMRNDTLDDQIRSNWVSSSKQQKREVRKKLEGQLDMIRGSLRMIEAKEGEINRYGNSCMLTGDTVNNIPNMFSSGLTSTGTSHDVFRPSRPSHQLNVSACENQGITEHVEREKRTPKANQFYRNSEFLLAKDKFPPAESKKKSRSNAKKQGGGELGHGFGPPSKVYKSCSALLERLMKHQHGWVFNAPVDVKGFGLHDYYTIIKHPMDLGTVKSKLTKNRYKSPREFAKDVRRTFHNAMTYNPKGQDVHIMAEELLKLFEDKWVGIEANYNREMSFTSEYGLNFLTPRSRQAPLVRPPPINVPNMVDRSERIMHPLNPQPKVIRPILRRKPSLKKPKADQPDKRDMTDEEKQKLNLNLQNLPGEKHDQVLRILKKRNAALSQRHDRNEVVIDILDPETLWELDRLVTNYKKSLSKKKRRAELAMQARLEAEKDIQEKNSTTIREEFPRREIAAEKNLSISLPSQAQKQADNQRKLSSSSASSSDSSSSSSDSDSDSFSSSGSDRT